MVEIGSMVIKGKMDSANMESGFKKMQRDIKKSDDLVLKMDFDFKRMGKNLSKVAKALAVFGATAVTAFVGLGLKSPYLAGALARMNVQMMKLGNTAGQIIKPIFESIAEDLIPGIREAITTFRPQIESLVETATEGIGDLAKVLKGDLDEIQNLIPKTSMMAIGAAAGYAIFGPPGLFIGAALGYAAGEAVGSSMEPDPEETDPREMTWQQSPFAKAMTGQDDPMAGLFGKGWGYYYNPEHGKWMYQSTPVGGLRKGYENFVDWWNTVSDKQITYFVPSGVPKGYGE